MFAGGAVLVAGLTPPESPDSGEACARCPLCFYSGKVRRSVLFGLLGEGRGDLGTHPRGLFLGLAKRGGALVALGPVRSALGIEKL